MRVAASVAKLAPVEKTFSFYDCGHNHNRFRGLEPCELTSLRTSVSLDSLETSQKER